MAIMLLRINIILLFRRRVSGMEIAKAVLEIKVGHWPFSDQFQHLVDQNQSDWPYFASFSVGKQCNSL